MYNLEDTQTYFHKGTASKNISEVSGNPHSSLMSLFNWSSCTRVWLGRCVLFLTSVLFLLSRIHICMPLFPTSVVVGHMT